MNRTNHFRAFWHSGGRQIRAILVNPELKVGIKTYRFKNLHPVKDLFVSIEVIESGRADVTYLERVWLAVLNS